MPASHRALLLIPLAALAAGCAELDPNDELSGIYFVKLKSEPAQVVSDVRSIADELGVEPIHIYDSASEGFSVRLPHGQLVEEVEGLKIVDYVERDEKETLKPPDELSELPIGDDEIPAGVARIGGPYGFAIDWDLVHVAVVDTGIEQAHPDLNVVAEADIVGESRDDWADGTDPQGHGTHVAGTIGAIADGDGVVGVAPGVPLHAVRVLGSDGSGYMTDIIAGLEYVLDNPEIRVVNMSLGGPAGSSMDDELDEAIARLEDAGVLVAIAAGNEGQDTVKVVPAGLDRGIVVSAYDASAGDSGFAWFSNYGGEVDIAAPGVGIWSTWPGQDYEALDGTSMATPHVAGAAAVYIALHPDASADEVRDALIASGEGGYAGQGGDHPEPLLDLEALLSR